MFADLLHHIKLDILEFCCCCFFFLFPAGTFYCKFLTIQYKKKRNPQAKTKQKKHLMKIIIICNYFFFNDYSFHLNKMHTLKNCECLARNNVTIILFCRAFFYKF